MPTTVGADDASSPRVSVVLPTYNNSKWIRESLASILDQTYRDIEVLVVDNASTDDSAKIVASVNVAQPGGTPPPGLPLRTCVIAMSVGLPAVMSAPTMKSIEPSRVRVMPCGP